MTTGHDRPQLTRQERLDLAISRTFPKLSGRAHGLVLRLGRGRFARTKRGIPIGVLTTTGARSGQARSVPLMYLDDGDRFLVVAANAGYDKNPAWLHNVKADPRATFTLGARSIPVSARILDAHERSDVWPRLVTHNPLWAGFQSLTDRQTPVVALHPSS